MKIKFIVWFIFLLMLLAPQPKFSTIICIITLSTCFNCNTPLPSKIHCVMICEPGLMLNSTCCWWSMRGNIKWSANFSQTPKILTFDLTDRNVTFSTKVSTMGVTHSTVLHLRGLIYYGDFHFTCWIIDISGNIWFHDGKIGCVSQPNLRKGRNKKICMPNVHLRTEERTSFCCAKQRPSSSK